MSNVPERFNWHTDGKADKRAVFSGRNYRFSFITDRLVRIEWDPKGKFEDRASQSFFYRNQPVPEFNATVDENNVLRVETEYIVLTYKEDAEFSADTLSVALKNAPGTVWHYGDKIEQLKGTTKTLDGVDGVTELNDGVVSRNGIAVIDDSDTLLLGEDGWIEVRNENTTDMYVFAYGHDYLAAVRDLYKVTGVPPMLPQYALGNWWSRYHKYTQDEYQDLMLRFEKENIPFSVAVVDMDWHLVDIPYEEGDENKSIGPSEDKYGRKYTNSCFGWTGYTWNTELFPDYKAFLKFLGDHNLKTSLNLHPADGVRHHESMYREMAEACGMNPDEGKQVCFDLLNPQFMEKYFDIIHHPYEEEGVDFWWMDWQQGESYRWLHEATENKDPREKLDPLWMLNHLHILDISRNGKRPMFFSRYAGIGSQRYPVGFSGDTLITWESLDFQPYFTANASNVGYSWWSHDIGGHMCGYRDDDLVLRWMQLGVLSPINRLHSSSNEFSGKEPWNLAPEHAKIAADWLRLRHQLFPYIYTMNYRNHHDLQPLVQPMYYGYPECSEAYSHKNQFMFGSELMVAPVTTKNDPVSRLAKTSVWFPKGEWFDIFTGLKYTGEKTVDVYRGLNEYPVFAKAGGILPMYKDYGDNKLINRDELEVRVFPGASNVFELYQDEGEYDRFEDGHFATTAMKLDWGEKPSFVIESAEGDLKLIPKKCTYKVIFCAVGKEPEVDVTLNGRVSKFASKYDRKEHTLTVTVTAKTVETVKITLSGEDLIYDNRDAADRVYDILLHSQMSFEEKEYAWRQIKDNRRYWGLGGMFSEQELKYVYGGIKEVCNLLKESSER